MYDRRGADVIELGRERGARTPVSKIDSVGELHGAARACGATSSTRDQLVLCVGARLGDLLRAEIPSLHVHSAGDAAQALACALRQAYDVACLDWDVSGADHGLALAVELRARQPWLGLMMRRPGWDSASRRDAFERGCDSCVDTESEPSELRACLTSLIRRSTRRSMGTATYRAFRIDLVGGVAEIGSRVVLLQPLQLRILAFLIQCAGRVVSHEELRQNVFRVTQASGSTSIARQISALRAALGHEASYIVTTRGGYLFADPSITDAASSSCAGRCGA